MEPRKAPLAAALAITLAFAAGTAIHADEAAMPGNPFTITLPDGYGEFVKQVQTAKSPEGEIVTTNWISKKAPTGEAVVVTVSKMPAKILDPKKLVASTRASLLKSLGATLESQEERPGDQPASLLLFRSDAAFFRSRFVVTEKRFYQLLYVGRSAEQRQDPAIGHTFDSFHISDATVAVNVATKSQSQ